MAKFKKYGKESKGDAMAELRGAGGNFEARCEYCGVWREVEVRQLACDTFFENYQADFTCCGVSQVAQLAVEKDELDFH
jgi:hypothetical protein